MNRGLRIGSGLRLGGLGAFGIRGGGVSDTTPPTVTITSTESDGTFAQPIPLTFTFSEAVTGFAVGDITVGAGGTVGNFAGSGASYTADLTVTTGLATITVDVAQNVCVDGAGNQNTAAAQFSITSGLAALDQFITDDAAPLTTPRTSEPGPGTLTVTETDGALAVSGAVLNITTPTTPAWAELGFYGSAVTRAAGIALHGKINYSTANRDGWFAFNATAAVGDLGTATGYYLGGHAYPDGINTILPLATSTTYQLVTVLRSIGSFALVKGGAFSEWTMAWVTNTRNDATEYPVLSIYNVSGIFDDLKVVQLAAPFTTDYGPATAYVASASAGETITGTANAINAMSWQAVTGETWNFYTRWTDDTHTWCIRCDQGGSTIKIIQIDAAETERASAAFTWNNGTTYRVAILQKDSANIQVWVDSVLKVSYVIGDAFNANVTGVKTDKAGTNLVSWPRTLSGTAKTVLDTAFP